MLKTLVFIVIECIANRLIFVINKDSFAVAWKSIAREGSVKIIVGNIFRRFPIPS
jgi:hypothetical protein